MTAVVRDQIMNVRDTGLTNMFDTNKVQQIAYNSGYYELVAYIEECRPKYFDFILTGKDS